MDDSILILIIWLLGLPSAGIFVATSGYGKSFKIKHIPLTILIAIFPLFAIATIGIGLISLGVWLYFKFQEKFPNIYDRINNFLNKDLIK